MYNGDCILESVSWRVCPGECILVSVCLRMYNGECTSIEYYCLTLNTFMYMSEKNSNRVKEIDDI